MATRASAWMISLLVSGALFAAGSATEADPVEAVGKAAGEWIKLRAETNRLESEWRNEHALLESTVNALKDRATNLEAKRDNLKVRTAADRAEMDALRSKQGTEAQELLKVDADLTVLSAKLIRLRDALPPRLSAALELPYRSLGAPEATGSERMQYTTTIVNRCAQFNRLVESGEEVLTLDGAEKSLEVIYWGLSHGYALDRSAKKVWLGAPVDGHWKWEPVNDAAEPVARLIAIYRDKADPAFVSVPAKLASISTSTR